MAVNLAEFSIKNRVLSVIVILLTVIGGWTAYKGMPRFEDPEFTIRTAQIIAPYPGASPVEVADEVVWGADARRVLEALGIVAGGQAQQLFGAVLPRLLEALPDARAAGNAVAGDQRLEREAEEVEAFLAAAERFGSVGVHGEARHHRDVGVDGVADRDAFVALDDRVVVVHPVLGLGRVGEGERECSDPGDEEHLAGLVEAAGRPRQRFTTEVEMPFETLVVPRAPPCRKWSRPA